jgi:hypothetical protein
MFKMRNEVCVLKYGRVVGLEFGVRGSGYGAECLKFGMKSVC